MTLKALIYNGLGLFYWFEIQQYIESYKFTNSFLIHKTYIPPKNPIFINPHLTITISLFILTF